MKGNGGASGGAAGGGEGGALGMVEIEEEERRLKQQASKLQVCACDLRETALSTYIRNKVVLRNTFTFCPVPLGHQDNVHHFRSVSMHRRWELLCNATTWE